MALALSLVQLQTACSVLGGDEDPPAGADTAAVASAGPEVVHAIRRALDRRADAILDHDEAAFTAGLDVGRPGFAAGQRAYLANLVQLPLETFAYRLDPDSLVPEGEGWWGTVAVSMELAGYDAAPVVTRDHYLFTLRESRYVLASVHDPAWERRSDVDPQPWDSGPVDVVADDGVLGVFDAGSSGSSERVVSDVRRALAAVAGVVPYHWTPRVVVYALSDPSYLASLDAAPGGRPLGLDAVSVQVPARDGIAGTRVVLHPSMVDRPGTARDRLIRHELTHVALGTRADAVPTWLSEGVAEYVSVRPIAPAARALSVEALAAAEAGPSSMPADEGFHGAATEAHYGLAWWACEYVARTYGEAMLWTLLDAMPGRDPDAVLGELLRIDSAELAGRAADLMLATYRPRSR